MANCRSLIEYFLIKRCTRDEQPRVQTYLSHGAASDFLRFPELWFGKDRCIRHRCGARI